MFILSITVRSEIIKHMSRISFSYSRTAKLASMNYDTGEGEAII